MCGIAGIFNHRSGRPPSEEDLQRMGGVLAHRGPDGEGLFIEGALGLAHRRLSIIDLELGQQPMRSSDGTLCISYNGEIYNYLELREELKRLGHAPRTNSDTEVALLAYRQWGLDFPSHLNGMFAMAIWDAPARRLVLCRDRLGIKPLYYAETPEGLAFASEMKALRALEGVDTQIDLQSFGQYLYAGYVLNPRTMLKGVLKLQPGCVLVCEARKPLETRRYWNLAFRPDERPTREEWGERVRELLDDSVRLQLRSDVPLGALLSGGVDSSAIVASMRRELNEVDTFCIGVDAPGAENELAWARRVADHLGTRHHESLLSAEEHADLLVEAARLLDEPLHEPMVAQLLAVCRQARREVKVLLSGEGADETWLGYPSYRLSYGMELLRAPFPRRAREPLGRTMRWLADHVPMSAKAKRWVRMGSEPLPRRYLGLNNMDPLVQARLMSGDVRSTLAEMDGRETMRPFYDEAGGPEPLAQMGAVDCRAWLVDNTLLRSDQMSMAASLELRVPFLDHRLVELALRVPSRFKVSWRDQKLVLKDAIAERLPAEVIGRRKVGFPTPLRQLFRQQWGAEAQSQLEASDAASRGFFDPTTLRTLFREHRDGTEDWSRQLFQMFMFELWSRN